MQQSRSSGVGAQAPPRWTSVVRRSPGATAPCPALSPLRRHASPGPVPRRRAVGQPRPR
jgi:hypothetical protein